jgi:SAM-dependent methyltransferase
MDTEAVRRDFDEIALLGEPHDSGADRYDSFLLGLVPNKARQLLDVGCGTGRLTCRLAKDERQVIGLDLSPVMIARAKARAVGMRGVTFVCGDFLSMDFERRFDCLVTAAALHHMPADAAIGGMKKLLQPGGRLVIHDIRRSTGLLDEIRAWTLLAGESASRLFRTGWPLSPRHVRRVWARHGARETYVSSSEAKLLQERLLPGSQFYTHSLWRYTIVWDRAA